MPTELVLDTSFVVEALMPAQKHHASAALFLGRLADNGSTVYLNRLLELELAEAAFQIGLRERHGKNWKRARHDGRARRRADRVLDRVLAVWASVLSELSWSGIGERQASQFLHTVALGRNGPTHQHWGHTSSLGMDPREQPQRSRASADIFIADLAFRIANRVQLSSDKLPLYVGAIADAFDPDVDYGRIAKSYEAE